MEYLLRVALTVAALAVPLTATAAIAAETPPAPPPATVGAPSIAALPPNLVKAQRDLARQFDAEQTMRQHFVEALMKYQGEVEAALRAAAPKATAEPPHFVPAPALPHSVPATEPASPAPK